MVEYKKINEKTIGVILDKKQVGKIKRIESWQFFPNGCKRGGEVFGSLLECKKSLEC